MFCTFRSLSSRANGTVTVDTTMSILVTENEKIASLGFQLNNALWNTDSLSQQFIVAWDV